VEQWKSGKVEKWNCIVRIVELSNFRIIIEPENISRVQFKNRMIMPKPARFIFAKMNYSLIVYSVLLLVTGYVLMKGNGNNNGSYYNTDIFSFRRITLAPVIILSGYTMMIFAIMRISKKQKKENGGD
jgi:Protein of unknown function (DUF3098)